MRILRAANSLLWPSAVFTVTATPSPFLLTSSAAAPVCTSMRRLNCFFRSSAISGSSASTSLSAISRMVTLVPIAAKKCPYSTAM